MSDLKWLGYFNDDAITDIAIEVGYRPTTQRSMNNSVTNESVSPSESDLAMIMVQPASEEEITKGEFFFELSKIFTTESQWDNLFTRQGTEVTLTQGDAHYRLRAFVADTAGGKNVHYASIIRVPVPSLV